MNRDDAIAGTAAKQSGKRRKFNEPINTSSSVLVSLVLHLWACGVVSAPVVQRIASACVAEVVASGGTASETLLALQSVGTAGAHPNLCRRDIIRKFTSQRDMFKPLTVRVPCIPVQHFVDTFVHWTNTPIMMPNEMFEHLWRYFPNKFKELLGCGLSLFWNKVSIKTILALTDKCKTTCWPGCRYKLICT